MEHQTRKVTATPQQRFEMSCQTMNSSTPIDFGKYRLHTLKGNDDVLVGKLLATCFRGEVDDSGESDADWQRIASDTFRGGICDVSSLMLFSGSEPVAAMVVIGHGRGRMLAMAMTHPQHRGRGLAEKLLRKCLDRLASAGIWELSLCVTDGNVAALRLYDKLGFKTRKQFAHLKVVIN